MTDPKNPKDGGKQDLRFPPAYYSIHGEEGQKVAGSPAEIDWRLPLITIIFGGVVLAGVVIALSQAEPAHPWLDLQSVSIDSDEGYLYLLISTGADDSEPPWDETGYLIGIDTYDAERGVKTLRDGIRFDTGIEFLIEITGPRTSRIRVVEGYDPYEAEDPIVSPRGAEPSFRELRFTSNRERFERSGKRIDAIEIDRGKLRFGSEAPTSPDLDTRTDVAVGTGRIEMRIPWNLLNVSDPSSRQVIHSESAGREIVESTQTHGFRFYVASIDLRSSLDEVADAIPSIGHSAPLYRWSTWEAPSYVIEPKLGYDLIRDTMNSIPDHPEIANDNDV